MAAENSTETQSVVLGRAQSQVQSLIDDVITSSFLDRNFQNAYWEMESVTTIQNDHLEELFMQKRAEMSQNREVIKSVLFTCYHGHHYIRSIMYNGLSVKGSRFNFLGDSSKGIFLCKHADIELRAAEVRQQERCWLFMFLALCGNVACVVPSDTNDCMRAPVEGTDCHISRVRARPTDELFVQAVRSQVYLFDRVGASNTTFNTHPRQCLPIAYVVYHRRGLQQQQNVSIYHFHCTNTNAAVIDLTSDDEEEERGGALNQTASSRSSSHEESDVMMPGAVAGQAGESNRLEEHFVLMVSDILPPSSIQEQVVSMPDNVRDTLLVVDDDDDDDDCQILPAGTIATATIGTIASLSGTLGTISPNSALLKSTAPSSFAAGTVTSNAPRSSTVSTSQFTVPSRPRVQLTVRATSSLQQSSRILQTSTRPRIVGQMSHGAPVLSQSSTLQSVSNVQKSPTLTTSHQSMQMPRIVASYSLGPQSAQKRATVSHCPPRQPAASPRTAAGIVTNLSNAQPLTSQTTLPTTPFSLVFLSPPHAAASVRPDIMQPVVQTNSPRRPSMPLLQQCLRQPPVTVQNLGSTVVAQHGPHFYVARIPVSGGLPSVVAAAAYAAGAAAGAAGNLSSVCNVSSALPMQNVFLYRCPPAPVQSTVSSSSPLPSMQLLRPLIHQPPPVVLRPGSVEAQIAAARATAFRLAQVRLSQGYLTADQQSEAQQAQTQFREALLMKARERQALEQPVTTLPPLDLLTMQCLVDSHHTPGTATRTVGINGSVYALDSPMLGGLTSTAPVSTHSLLSNNTLSTSSRSFSSLSTSTSAASNVTSSDNPSWMNELFQEVIQPEVVQLQSPIVIMPDSCDIEPQIKQELTTSGNGGRRRRHGDIICIDSSSDSETDTAAEEESGQRMRTRPEVDSVPDALSASAPETDFVVTAVGGIDGTESSFGGEMAVTIRSDVGCVVSLTEPPESVAAGLLSDEPIHPAVIEPDSTESCPSEFLAVVPPATSELLPFSFDDIIATTSSSSSQSGKLPIFADEPIPLNSIPNTTNGVTNSAGELSICTSEPIVFNTNVNVSSCAGENLPIFADQPIVLNVLPVVAGNIVAASLPNGIPVLPTRTDTNVLGTVTRMPPSFGSKQPPAVSTVTTVAMAIPTAAVNVQSEAVVMTTSALRSIPVTTCAPQFLTNVAVQLVSGLRTDRMRQNVESAAQVAVQLQSTNRKRSLSQDGGTEIFSSPAVTLSLSTNEPSATATKQTKGSLPPLSKEWTKHSAEPSQKSKRGKSTSKQHKKTSPNTNKTPSPLQKQTNSVKSKSATQTKLPEDLQETVVYHINEDGSVEVRLEETDVMKPSDSGDSEAVIYHVNKDGSVEVMIDEEDSDRITTGNTRRQLRKRKQRAGLEAVMELDHGVSSTWCSESLCMGIAKLFGTLRVVNLPEHSSPSPVLKSTGDDSSPTGKDQKVNRTGGKSLGELDVDAADTESDDDSGSLCIDTSTSSEDELVEMPVSRHDEDVESSASLAISTERCLTAGSHSDNNRLSERTVKVGEAVSFCDEVEIGRTSTPVLSGRIKCSLSDIDISSCPTSVPPDDTKVQAVSMTTRMKNLNTSPHCAVGAESRCNDGNDVSQLAKRIKLSPMENGMEKVILGDDQSSPQETKMEEGMKVVVDVKESQHGSIKIACESSKVLPRQVKQSETCETKQSEQATQPVQTEPHPCLVQPPAADAGTDAVDGQDSERHQIDNEADDDLNNSDDLWFVDIDSETEDFTEIERVEVKKEVVSEHTADQPADAVSCETEGANNSPNLSTTPASTTDSAFCMLEASHTGSVAETNCQEERSIQKDNAPSQESTAELHDDIASESDVTVGKQDDHAQLSQSEKDSAFDVWREPENIEPEKCDNVESEVCAAQTDGITDEFQSEVTDHAVSADKLSSSNFNSATRVPPVTSEDDNLCQSAAGESKKQNTKIPANSAIVSNKEGRTAGSCHVSDACSVELSLQPEDSLAETDANCIEADSAVTDSISDDVADAMTDMLNCCHLANSIAETEKACSAGGDCIPLVNRATVFEMLYNRLSSENATCRQSDNASQKSPSAVTSVQTPKNKETTLGQAMLDFLKKQKTVAKSKKPGPSAAVAGVTNTEQSSTSECRTVGNTIDQQPRSNDERVRHEGQVGNTVDQLLPRSNDERVRHEGQVGNTIDQQPRSNDERVGHEGQVGNTVDQLPRSNDERVRHEGQVGNTVDQLLPRSNDERVRHKNQVSDKVSADNERSQLQLKGRSKRKQIMAAMKATLASVNSEQISPASSRQLSPAMSKTVDLMSGRKSIGLVANQAAAMLLTHSEKSSDDQHHLPFQNESESTSLLDEVQWLMPPSAFDSCNVEAISPTWMNDSDTEISSPQPPRAASPLSPARSCTNLSETVERQKLHAFGLPSSTIHCSDDSFEVRAISPNWMLDVDGKVESPMKPTRCVSPLSPVRCNSTLTVNSLVGSRSSHTAEERCLPASASPSAIVSSAKACDVPSSLFCNPDDDSLHASRTVSPIFPDRNQQVVNVENKSNESLNKAEKFSPTKSCLKKDGSRLAIEHSKIPKKITLADYKNRKSYTGDNQAAPVHDDPSGVMHVSTDEIQSNVSCVKEADSKKDETVDIDIINVITGILKGMAPDADGSRAVSRADDEMLSLPCQLTVEESVAPCHAEETCQQMESAKKADDNELKLEEDELEEGECVSPPPSIKVKKSKKSKHKSKKSKHLSKIPWKFTLIPVDIETSELCYSAVKNRDIAAASFTPTDPRDRRPHPKPPSDAAATETSTFLFEDISNDADSGEVHELAVVNLYEDLGDETDVDDAGGQREPLQRYSQTHELVSLKSSRPISPNTAKQQRLLRFSDLSTSLMSGERQEFGEDVAAVDRSEGGIRWPAEISVFSDKDTTPNNSHARQAEHQLRSPVRIVVPTSSQNRMKYPPAIPSILNDIDCEMVPEEDRYHPGEDLRSKLATNRRVVIFDSTKKDTSLHVKVKPSTSASTSKCVDFDFDDAPLSPDDCGQVISDDPLFNLPTQPGKSTDSATLNKKTMHDKFEKRHLLTWKNLVDREREQAASSNLSKADDDYLSMKCLVQQVVAYFVNLPATDKEEPETAAIASLKLSKDLATQELVYVDVLSQLTEDEMNSISDERPQLLKELSLDIVLRNVEEQLCHMNQQLFRDMVEDAEVRCYERGWIDKSLLEYNLLLLTRHMIYGQMAELHRYQKSHLVYVLPNDLRLDVEVGQFISVEGCVLFLERPTLPLPMCLELFCLKVEIEDVQSVLATEGSSLRAECHRLMCQLGWLHKERKRVLNFLTMRSNKSRNKIHSSLKLLRQWYQSAQDYLEGSGNNDREEMLEFVRTHSAVLDNHLSGIKKLRNVGFSLWEQKP